jgi:hypothetical protein
MCSTPARRRCFRRCRRPGKRLRIRAHRPGLRSAVGAPGAFGGRPGSVPGRTALRGTATPWEAALQRWMESVAPREHLFVRPRLGAPGDVVRLTAAEGWMLNVIVARRFDSREIARAQRHRRFLRCGGRGPGPAALGVTVTSDELLSSTEPISRSRLRQQRSHPCHGAAGCRPAGAAGAIPRMVDHIRIGDAYRPVVLPDDRPPSSQRTAGWS